MNKSMKKRVVALINAANNHLAIIDCTGESRDLYNKMFNDVYLLRKAVDEIAFEFDYDLDQGMYIP